MNTESKNQKELSNEEIMQDIKRLADKADEVSNQQLDLFLGDIGDEDIDNGFNVGALLDAADPTTSHKIYYAIRRLLIEYLPKGKENKSLRQKIYDEKNLFLNRGIDKRPDGIRGSDGRMTYIDPFLKETLKIVADWIATGANSFDIWKAFWDLNEEKGYHSNMNTPK
jgi:hypothetical protein